MNERFMNERIEKMMKHEEEMKEKYGYYIHCIIDVDPLEAHTHGLMDVGYPEVGIKLGLDPDNVHRMLNVVAQKILKKEITCSDGTTLQLDELCTLPVTFKLLTEDLTPSIILRIIFPDVNGRFPWDEGCNQEFKKQWSLEDELNNKEAIL